MKYRSWGMESGCRIGLNRRDPKTAKGSDWVTKDKLRQYRNLIDDIKKKEYRLLELETRATNITYCMEQDPVSGGGSKDKMADQVAAIVELKDEINEQLAVLYRKEREIRRAIKGLESRERILMELKYIEGLRWEEVAVEMNYSWQHIHRLHAECLERLK